MRPRWEIVHVDLVSSIRLRRLGGVCLGLGLTLSPGCRPDHPHADPDGRDAGAAVSCAAADFRIARFPLDGVNGHDWVINGYVDLDASKTGIEDYRGHTGARARTYEGHRGIDIDIPSFRQMDSGAAVIHAVAPGIVDQVIQDHPDRNVHCNGPWNLVRVRHASGFYVLYGHIKRGSSRVTVGQSVGAGTPLAIVGSAGCSTQPHLHLEVQSCSRAAIETLSQAGMWSRPPDYDPASDVLDLMLMIGGAPTLAQIKDPPPDARVVAPGALLGVGLSAAIRGGDLVALELIGPQGHSSLQTFAMTEGAPFGHRYASAAFPIGRAAGRWTIEAWINGVLAARRAFTVPAIEPLR